MEVAGIRLNCSGCAGSGEMACLGKCGGDGIIEPSPAGDVNGLYPTPGVNPYPDSACAICKGTGQKICPSCSGSGSRSSIQYGTNFGFGSSTYSTNSRCAACRGTGRVICTYCFGNG